MVNHVTIKDLGYIEAAQLIALLKDDQILRNDLGFSVKDCPTAEDFLIEITEWCDSHRATTFAILAGGVAIGTISLSHRSRDGRSAHVGYWIGSRYHRRGYGTKAFEAVLNKAAREGIGCLSASISSDNIPSIRIWEKHGAKALEVSPGKLRYTISPLPHSDLRLTWTTMKIRKFRQEDSEELTELTDQADRSLRKVYRPTEAGYKNRSRISDGLKRIVAVSGEKIVGTAQYYSDGNFMRILGMAVHEEYRSRGIARSIFRHVVDLATDSGYAAVRLSTIRETGNVPVFQRMGFEIVGQHQDELCEGINGEPVTDIEMEFRLPRPGPEGKA